MKIVVSIMTFLLYCYSYCFSWKNGNTKNLKKNLFLFFYYYFLFNPKVFIFFSFLLKSTINHVQEAMVEEDEEVPDEIKWMLEQERKAIQPHQEEIEIINLGTDEDKKEIKIGALLDATVKKRVIELLREFADVFAWSYKDMPGLYPEVVEHCLPLKPECPPVKQKLRRSHPDMALKIKE